MAALPFLATILLGAQAPHGTSDDAGATTPADLFRTRCAACHVPPDPRFAVERAWIAQVADTA